MKKRLQKLEEWTMLALMGFSVLAVAGSLVWILGTIMVKGLPAINWAMLTQTPRGGYYAGKEGGILNAILGSLALGIGATLLAFIISLPVVIYLHLHRRRHSRFSQFMRFLFDVLYGIPAIVYGAFGFTLMVALGLKASLLAGIITVAFLVTPIMARSMDEVFKMIPFELKEAALAMGSTRWEVATKVLLRQAAPGIMTAVLLAFGRGIGDAAAVLFTASFSDALPTSLAKPVGTLPLAIFFQLGTPFPEVQARGYASAFVLTVLILTINLLARFLTRKFTQNVVR